MMRFLLLGAMAAVLSGCIGAGSISGVEKARSNIFPSMIGIDLLGADREIPATFAGDLNIVAVAFQRDQQEDVNTWITVADEIMAGNGHVRFYEVPLIYELNMANRFWVNNGMRSGIPSVEARERTITVYTDRDAFLEAADMSADVITLLLLDDEGQILWRTDGVANEKSVEDLKAKIESYQG